MVIRFECNHCGKKLGIADTEAGKLIKCPGCGGKVRIPSQSAVTGPPAVPAKKPTAPDARPVPPTKPPPPKPAPAKRPPPQEDLVEVDPIDEPPPSRAARTRPARRREEDEEDEEPRRRSRRARSRRYEDEDEEEDEDYGEEEDDEDFDEEKGVFSPNRIRGVVGIVFGGVVLAFGLFYPRLQEGDSMAEALKWGVIGLAGLMFAAGIFYLVKG